MAEENQSVESTVGGIRRNSRKKYSAEEKVRIVLESLRGEVTIANGCTQPTKNSPCHSVWQGELATAYRSRI